MGLKEKRKRWLTNPDDYWYPDEDVNTAIENFRKHIQNEIATLLKVSEDSEIKNNKDEYNHCVAMIKVLEKLEHKFVEEFEK